MELSQGRLRHAIIGVSAGIFKSHRPALDLPVVDVVAVADINAESGQQQADELGCPFYTDYHRLLAEVRPDVAVILTPHPLHASIAIECLQAGCHVLVEKPMAIQVADADRMIATAVQQQRLLGVVFQHRFRPEIRTAKKLLQEGRLGTIERVEMSAVWTRPASYFRLAPWRGTWAGEGGGIIINQASHNLDILCHLLGMPRRVYAWTRTLLHRIEVEDTVQAMLEWDDGAMGSVHISTAEADVPERLKIVGTGGILEIGHGKLLFEKLDMDLKEYAATCPDPYASPARHPVAVELEESSTGYISLYTNFHNAILHGGQPSSDGVQGRMSLELANAMIYASYTHNEVELPLDRQRYAALLEGLQRRSLSLKKEEGND